MNARPLLIAIAVLLLGGLVAVGAYDAGLAQNVAQNVPAASGAPVGYYGPHYFGWGFGFFPFGFLFPLLGLFLIFALVRGLFWGGRWGGYYGHRGWYGDQHDVPGRFEEWHRRAHGDTSTPPTDRSAPPRQ